MQAKLLRVLQEREFVRLGGVKTLSSDFRLIAATNRDLSGQVGLGQFRKDLYFRLNAVTLTLPPLREREKDIIVLAHHFLSLYAEKYDKEPLHLTQEDRSILMEYPWPGNVRELKHVMERTILLSRNGKADFGALGIPALGMTQPVAQASSIPPQPPTTDTLEDLPSLEEFDRRYIQYVLQKTNGKISGPRSASEVLGMKRTTLNKRLKRLGIR